MVFLSRDLSADTTVAQMRSDCQTVSALVADVTMRTITRIFRSLYLRGGSISDYSDIDEKRIFKIFGHVLNHRKQNDTVILLILSELI